MHLNRHVEVAAIAERFLRTRHQPAHKRSEARGIVHIKYANHMLQMQVVRSYMHVTGSGPIAGLLDACKTIWREDGLKGFYRGCGTNLLRTTPAAALTFTSFELIARGLRQVRLKYIIVHCHPALSGICMTSSTVCQSYVSGGYWPLTAIRACMM